MVYDKVIRGQYVQIRSIGLEDAEFSMEIRQDEKRTKYLHAVDADIEKQTKWINWQRENPGDYFFIAETLDGEKVGTVGIYDIEGKVGHLGRLLMVGNPFQTFEALLLSIRFAYNELGLDELYGDVIVENTASLNISEAVGIHFDEPIYVEELGQWVKYGSAYKNEFPEYESKIEKLIYRN